VVKTLGNHIRKRRLDLGLWQRTLAERLGVSEMTVGNWELGKEQPRIRLTAAIIAFIGYDPEPGSDSLPCRLRAIRRRLGLTQAELATRLGQDEKQICRWEAGRRTPPPAITGRVDQALRGLEGRPAEAGPESVSYFDVTRWRRRMPVGVALRPETSGERMRARRLELALSATFVARETGTSRGTLYRIERGRQTASRDLERRLRTLLRMNDAR